MGKKEVKQCVEREYTCDGCEAAFECREPIHQKARRKCPDCGKYKLRRVFQLPHIVTGAVSLGSWGERNFKRIGKDTIQEREALAAQKRISVDEALRAKPLPNGMKRIEKPKQTTPPWWRPNTTKPDMKVASFTPEQKKEFILTGKRPTGK